MLTWESISWPSIAEALSQKTDLFFSAYIAVGLIKYSKTDQRGEGRSAGKKISERVPVDRTQWKCFVYSILVYDQETVKSLIFMRSDFHDVPKKC
jgi:hypothetical protein